MILYNEKYYTLTKTNIPFDKIESIVSPYIYKNTKKDLWFCCLASKLTEFNKTIDSLFALNNQLYPKNHLAKIVFIKKFLQYDPSLRKHYFPLKTEKSDLACVNGNILIGISFEKIEITDKKKVVLLNIAMD